MLNILLKLNNRVFYDVTETLDIIYLGEVRDLEVGAHLVCMFKDDHMPRFENAMSYMCQDGKIYGLAFKDNDGVFYNYLVIGRHNGIYILISKQLTHRKPKISSISVSKIRQMKSVCVVVAHTKTIPSKTRGPGYGLPGLWTCSPSKVK